MTTIRTTTLIEIPRRESAQPYQHLCPRCPSATWDGSEWYRWGETAWDVRLARELIRDNPRRLHTVTREQFENLPLIIWPESTESIQVRLTNPTLYIPDPAHFDHIPEGVLFEPPIFAPVVLESPARIDFVLIDGTHRAAKRLRAGEPAVPSYFLSLEESQQCRDSAQWYAEATLGLAELLKLEQEAERL